MSSNIIHLLYNLNTNNKIKFFHNNFIYHLFFCIYDIDKMFFDDIIVFVVGA